MSGAHLTLEELDLLNQVVGSRDAALRLLARDVAQGRVLTISEANALRDAIGDELAESGVDAEIGAVNERGRQLDALIDRIGALSAPHDAPGSG